MSQRRDEVAVTSATSKSAAWSVSVCHVSCLSKCIHESGVSYGIRCCWQPWLGSFLL